MNILRNSEYNETDSFFRRKSDSEAASWTSGVPAEFAGNPSVLVEVAGNPNVQGAVVVVI
jgi:hypothetical protein